MSDAEPRNPFTRRGFIFGAITVGALAAAAILLAFTSTGGGGSQGNAVAAPTSVVTVTATADPATASVCGLAGFEAAGTLTAAPETKWSIVGIMAAPNSKAAGPGVTDADGVRSCYAHTPTGALFAVANSWAMGSDARLAPLAVAANTAPGPGRDAAMAAQNTRSNSGVSVQIAGFKVLSYSEAEATIDTAFTLNNGTLMSFASTMKWVEGDWKAELTDDGQPPFRPVVLQSLGGYNAWSGLS
ncbi:hypothetical protein [Subtercola boreus]|uniref:DUF8175 domain-containing protein n=1 Tax=Subtercola boreus TaxID=120213 RepID=A0A3E0W8Z2_9MICO|nr:hypothetical protein [Subtercola boreus]RFA17744.1 hypothetical protein B7R24_16490 [Subtercola boreus]RFA17773.1 hypothetical protein B7R23_16660 [Subtercola boreus]RFA24506.1 hypothetical protein B7R25_16655 [Subtercola boreus]